jgi:hypothetical protein
MKQIILEMREDTLEKLKRKYGLEDWTSNKFIFNSMNKIDTALQKKAFVFIQKLLEAGMNLEQIMTNDWEASPAIIVYVNGKEFRRFSDFDLQRALGRKTVKKLNEAYDAEVAKTILQQLGGAGRLKAMTGAKNFTADGQSISFQIPRANGVRAVKITLNAMDTYDLKFYGGNNEWKVIKELSGIYDDGLKDAIESTTGLRLSLEEQNLQAPSADTGLDAPKYAEGTVVREKDTQTEFPFMKDFNKLTGNEYEKNK